MFFKNIMLLAAMALSVAAVPAPIEARTDSPTCPTNYNAKCCNTSSGGILQLISIACIDLLGPTCDNTVVCCPNSGNGITVQACIPVTL